MAQSLVENIFSNKVFAWPDIQINPAFLFWTAALSEWQRHRSHETFDTHST